MHTNTMMMNLPMHPSMATPKSPTSSSSSSSKNDIAGIAEELESMMRNLTAAMEAVV